MEGQRKITRNEHNISEGQARELPLDLEMVHGLSKAETRSYIVSDTLKGAECRQAAKALQAASFKGMISLNHGDYAEQSLQEDIAAVYDALVKGLSLGVKKGEGAMKDEGKMLLRDVRADPIMDDSFMEMMYYEGQPMFVKATAYSMAALHDAASATLKYQNIHRGAAMLLWLCTRSSIHPG